LSPARATVVEEVHDGGGGVESFDWGGLVAGEAVHGDDLHLIPEPGGLGFKPRLERLLRAAFDHRQ